MKWQWLVAPGSAIYLVPLVLLAGAAVVLRDRSATRAVLRWWAAVAGVCLLVAASKIAFYGWGTGVRAWDLTCFSGHTALSLAVWPVVLMLLAPARWRGLRAAAVLAGLGLAGLIGWSRVPLGAHPLSEVLAGAVLGLAAGATGIVLLRCRQLSWQAPPVLAVLALLMLGPWMRDWPGLPTERWFVQIGAQLSGRDKPWNRKHWKRAVPPAVQVWQSPPGTALPARCGGGCAWSESLVMVQA